MTGSFGGLTQTTTRRSFACNDRGVARTIAKQPFLCNINDANGVFQVSYGEADYFEMVNCLSGDSVSNMFEKALTLANQNKSAVGFNAGAQNFTKIFIKDADIFVELFNGGNVPAYLDLYDMYPIRDWTANSDAPKSLVYNGMSGLIHTDAGATPSYNQISSKPTQSIAFCERWHIFKHRFVFLAPGQRHIHKVHIDYNWSINRDLYLDSAGDQPLKLPRKKGYFLMVRLRGGVVTSHSTGTESTTAQVKVGWVASLRTRWNFVLNTFPETHMETSLDTSPAAAQTVTAAGSAVASTAYIT